MFLQKQNSKKCFFATGIVGGFLLQHALQGWCPPVELFRRTGVRTTLKINHEKEALKNLIPQNVKEGKNQFDAYFILMRFGYKMVV